MDRCEARCFGPDPRRSNRTPAGRSDLARRSRASRCVRCRCRHDTRRREPPAGGWERSLKPEYQPEQREAALSRWKAQLRRPDRLQIDRRAAERQLGLLAQFAHPGNREGGAFVRADLRIAVAIELLDGLECRDLGHIKHIEHAHLARRQLQPAVAVDREVPERMRGATAGTIIAANRANAASAQRWSHTCPVRRFEAP